MAQIFGRQANWIARTVLVGVPVLALLSIAVAEGFDRSDYVTEKNKFVDQPVPFSHAHHVGEIGVDCRYCHTQVEKGAYAQIPTSETCMTCHSQIWSKSPMLAPVRDSYKSGLPLIWQRVTKLPDFVYFNHSIHVQKGVACTTCHGPMQSMPLTRLEHPMQMQFCVNCHRDPSHQLRPKNEVANPFYESPQDQVTLSEALARQYDVHPKTDCIVCHR